MPEPVLNCHLEAPVCASSLSPPSRHSHGCLALFNGPSSRAHVLPRDRRLPARGGAFKEAAMANEHSFQRCGGGGSLPRKEDDRHLRGRGQFVADIALRGTREVVFL